MDSFILQASPVSPGETKQVLLNVKDAPYYAAGQTSYNTGSGFWLGIDGGVAKLSLGDGGVASFITWNGTTLTVGGSVVLESPPLVKEVIAVGATVTILTDYLLLLADRLIIDGTVTIDGSLALVA